MPIIGSTTLRDVKLVFSWPTRTEATGSSFPESCESRPVFLAFMRESEEIGRGGRESKGSSDAAHPWRQK